MSAIPGSPVRAVFARLGWDSGDRRVRAPRPSADVPSARPHPGVALLLKTNAKPQFDKTVTRQSTPLFRVFSILNHVVPALPQPVALDSVLIVILIANEYLENRAKS